MTQVNFYTLGSEVPAERLRLACRIAEKALSLGHQVHIRVASEQQARELDELLWTFRPGSFVPHQQLADSAQQPEPVTIGAATAPAPEHGDVLINLAPQPCDPPDQFARINEIIAGDETSRAEGRQRYRFYQAAGAELTTHKLQS